MSSIPFIPCMYVLDVFRFSESAQADGHEVEVLHTFRPKIPTPRGRFFDDAVGPEFKKPNDRGIAANPILQSGVTTWSWKREKKKKKAVTRQQLSMFSFKNFHECRFKNDFFGVFLFFFF